MRFSIALSMVPALALAACTMEEGAPDVDEAENYTQPVEGADRTEPVTVPPPGDAPSTSGSPSVARAAGDAADDCGASKVQSFIGQEATVPVRTEVARIASPSYDRWIYPDTIVTQDRDMARLNVTMEKGTDVIVSLECG